MELPLDTSFLFSSLLSEHSMDFTFYTDTTFSINQGSSSTSPASSPDAFVCSLKYSDNGSDMAQSPTSGLFSSEPTWNNEMNSWVLPDFDYQFPSSV